MTEQSHLPYALPTIDEEEIAAVTDTLRSNWLSKGPKTIEFEKRFAEYVGARYAVAMNSCTAALHTALVAREIGAGDEVITTPLTFTATASTIIHAGARPVFVDIDPQTGCIDPDLIEERITPRTKAIVPVHYAGQACDMDRIMEIAREHSLFVSEDAAHAVYSTYKGRMIGSIGDATSFSFYATKNLCTGEGGMLTTDDRELADRARILSLHGMSKNAWNRYDKKGSWFYEVLYPGFKYNMTDIQAALGLQQLMKLEKMQHVREKYAEMYSRALSGIPGLTLPRAVEGSRHAWHLYVLRLDENELKIGRDQFIEELAKMNIGTSVHFIPVHLHPYYQKAYGFKEGMYPRCESFYRSIVSLPLYPRMTEEDVLRVIGAVKAIIGQARGKAPKRLEEPQSMAAMR